MTIIIEQPHVDAVAERKVVAGGDPAELVLDGGFVVPDSNAFGSSFRLIYQIETFLTILVPVCIGGDQHSATSEAAADKLYFSIGGDQHSATSEAAADKNYDAESERKKTVEEFYRVNHISQTYEFVARMRAEYMRLDKTQMSVWECIELLNEFIDDSDPDLDMPQIEHLLQTAEAIRKDYPDEDWLHLTGLIHDLGKVLLHPSFGGLPQWAVVGDTFPVGCAYDECNVHFKYLKENPDYHDPRFNTKFGAYSKGCGLDNILMSWGHDDYMYLVAKENKTTLPSAGLFIIRYHSFYPLHKHGAYMHLMNDEDKENLKWLHVFNKYDLYSKSNDRIDVDKVKPYYMSLIDKYFPAKLRW